MNGPLQSPQPPGVGVATAPEEKTGVHPATRDFTRWVGWLSTLRTLGAMVVVIFIAGVLSWERIGAMIDKRADARFEMLAPRVTTLEHRADFTDANVQEIALDLRAFYRVSITTGTSPRLERPPVVHVFAPDGGP